MNNNQTLIAQCEEKVRQWLSPVFSEETCFAAEAMINNDDKADLIESFYKNLKFGTGGLHGIAGTGSNRTNIYTVGMATQGFANCLKINFKDKEQISVVVYHGCRSNSRLFVGTVANIFFANGIKVYLFDDLRSTLGCSFAICHLKVQAGVNITASHNPHEYNGHKVCWNDGAQVLAPHDKGIIDEVNKVKVEDIKFKDNKTLIQIVGKDVNKVYLGQVETISIDPQVIKNQHDLKVTHIPLHDTGRVIIPRALASWGFDNVHCVREQMVKDGNLPTVNRPNPEIAETLTPGLRDVEALGVDILMASDPDVDRIDMACKNSDDEWVLISGNQTRLLFLWYIITNRQAVGKMKLTDFIVKIIITTEAIRKIAEKQNVEVRDCYTGFRWIACEAALSENKQQYTSGGEESYGLPAEDLVRSRDAISVCALLAEICVYAEDHDKTLHSILMDVYMEYGYSRECTINTECPGKSGADEIQQIMKNLRSSPPKEPGGSVIDVYKDSQSLEVVKADGPKEKMDMPDTSNALQQFYTDGTKVSVHPSGTESKTGFYFEIKDTMNSTSDLPACEQRAIVKIEAIKKSLDL